MNVFEKAAEQIIAWLSDWIRIEDPKSKWTIESFAEANYDEEIIKPHCVTCTIVNRCWFKNEPNKRPNEFNYSKYSVLQIPLINRGLYHPKCHDKKYPINSPTPNQITIFDLERRMDYLFQDKKVWLSKMGYNEDDKFEVFQLLEKLSKEAYCQGDYINNPPEEKKKKYGFRIRLNLPFPGKREKLGKTYKITSSYIVYPNGKLKNNTPIGGWGK